MLAKQMITLFRGSLIEYVSIVIFSFGLALLSLMQLYFHQVHGYSIFQSSILLSSATLGQFLGSLTSRYYVRCIKYILAKFALPNVCPLRAAICLLALFSGILFVFFGKDQTYYSFLYLSFLLGLFLAFFLPINMSLLTNNITVEETVVVAFLRRWSLNIGACVAFAMMGYITKNAHQLFNYMAVACFLVFVLEVMGLVKAKITKDSVNMSVKKISFSAISRSVWIWMAGVFLAYFVFFQTISTYPIFLQEYANINIVYFSRLMIVNVVTVLVLQFLAPLLEKYVNISAISAIGVVLVGVGIVMVIFKHDALIFLSVIIWSVGEIFLLGITPVYAKIFSGEDQEKNLQYSSNYYAICYAAKMAAPLLGSYFYTRLNFHETFFIAIFVVSIIAGICFFCLGSISNGFKNRS